MTLSLKIEPRRGLEAGDEPGVYRAVDSDPQMIWTPDGDEAARLDGRGAVRLTVRLQALNGEIAEPCVYLDWGDGYSDEACSRLIAVEDDLYVATAYTNAGALRRLRFDPSSAPCRFRLGEMTLEPLGDQMPAIVRLSPVRRLVRRVLRRAPSRLQRAARQMRLVIAGPPQARRQVLGRVFAPFSTVRWRRAYVHGFEVARNLRSPFYAAKPLLPPRRDPDGARTVAFYLPQFHPIPQNDQWWGAGFTEWTNVTKATPQFTGHVQPRLPADLGYYDLRTSETRRAQADLARRFGVDAFCFHYYWFAGERLLERPLDAFVDDPDIDLPFALCWANENWTRRWDGQESDILIGQRHSPEDDVAVLDDLARYMRSPRYLRVGGKPLLVVYRPDALPDAAATLVRWRERARATGLGELFIICTDAFGFANYKAKGFDGLVEFPPHALRLGEITDQVELLNPAFRGRIYDYPTLVRDKTMELAERRDPRRFPGVMPAWDNEARKPGAGHVFHDARPDHFHAWTRAALTCAKRIARPDERLVFVNAWNEWAEGTYLEPDRWFGHGFGQALRSAIEADAPRIPADHPLLARTRAEKRGAVVLLHCYYPELIDYFASRLAAIGDTVDIDITFPETWTEQELQALATAFPTARLTPTPNRGRDMAPFVAALTRAKADGYAVFCKLHSKRSAHMANGDAWRERLVETLVSPARLGEVLARFRNDPKLGMLSGENDRMTLGEHGVMHNNRQQVDRLAGRMKLRWTAETPFTAGSMFWGRTAAFAPLLNLSNDDLDFEVELGRIDGDLPHALERLTGAIVLASGHTAEWSL